MNGEKGQALPLAILALAIGALLIAPFLGHASSSVIGSQAYADTIAYRNACDAGVEHAIWSLVYGEMGELIPNPGDQITYQLPETINGVIPTVTVTANGTSGSSTTGNITKKIGSFEYDTTAGYEPDIIQVGSHVYAIAYRGTSNGGYLKTVTIAADGSISPAVISSLMFDSKTGYTPKIIQISGNVYAIAYRGSSSDGILKTVTIAADGAISSSIISSLTFDSKTGYTPDIIHISGNVYAIVYRGSNSDGTLKTVTITANGTISPAIISSLTFDSTGYEPEIIHISGNVYAIAYRGSSSDGTLKTVTITTNGTISPAVISSLIFDDSTGDTPDIFNISGNVYAIIYNGASNNGYLKTVTIAPNGTISPAIIATLAFGNRLYTPHILPVIGNVYLTVGRGSGNDGILRTIEIATDGSISNDKISSFVFDSSTGYEPAIIQISSGIFSIAYRGSSNDGFVTTIGVTTTTGANAYKIVASASNTSIQAYVSTGNTTASIFSWQIR